MKLLLDTHALLWWLADDHQLGPRARKLIEDPDTEVLVSVVSLWEIVVKVRVGRLQAHVEDIWEAVLEAGFTVLDIGIAHLLDLVALPMLHRDPFDHLLMAQARVEGAVFLSQDGYTPSYPVHHVTCSDAPGSASGLP